MPFPFYALHYDHCYRLRNLATPGEVYKLQLAAPFLAGLKPIQKVNIFDAINVFINHKNGFEAKFFDPNEYCASKRTLELKNDYFNICNDWLYITSFSSRDSAQRIFDYFSITDCKMFRFKNCGITAQFLKYIKRKTKCVERLSFVNCTFEDAVTPKFFCKIFKTLKMLKFDRGCPADGNWIEAFVAAKYSGIQCLCFDRVPFDFLQASKRTWMRFFQMQSQTMQMCVVLKVDADKFTVMEVLNYLFHDGWRRLIGPKQKVNVYHYNGTILRH